MAKWHAQIGDPTLADSILDRLVHAAHRIELRWRLDAEEPTQSAGARQELKGH